jgi:hypothetical protein
MNQEREKQATEDEKFSERLDASINRICDQFQKNTGLHQMRFQGIKLVSLSALTVQTVAAHAAVMDSLDNNFKAAEFMDQYIEDIREGLSEAFIEFQKNIAAEEH